MTSLRGLVPVTFIFTADRAALVPFYCDTLGLKLVSQDAFGAVFDLGGTQMRLTDIAGHKPSPHTVLGWEVEDIVATMDALVAKGVTFAIYPGFGQDERGVWTSPDGAARIAWFHDTEGNNLSLMQRG
jgi:catechol 2,3-dioxygenase-like lactoylglutathione lyase family enzyme